MKRILPIVEGDGDVRAVPVLLRRVAHAHHCFDLDIRSPQRRGDLFAVRAKFDNFLKVALKEDCPILWVMDYDGDGCVDPDADRAALLARANAIDARTAIDFVFFVKEFESIFLADHETTRAVFTDIPATAPFPADPESIRGAKEALSALRPKGSAYKEIQHQPQLAARVDLERLRARSPSFVRFEHSVRGLLDL